MLLLKSFVYEERVVSNKFENWHIIYPLLLWDINHLLVFSLNDLLRPMLESFWRSKKISVIISRIKIVEKRVNFALSSFCNHKTEIMFKSQFVQHVSTLNLVLINHKSFSSPVSRDVKVTIYPIYSSVEISLEKSIFKPESDIVIPCSIKVFWYYLYLKYLITFCFYTSKV